MKKIILILAILFLGVYTNAQDTKNQISIGYGVVSIQGIADAELTILSDLFTDIFTLGTTKINSSSTGTGVIELRMKHFVGERVSIGIRMNYANYNHEDDITFTDGSTTTMKWYNRFITGMLDFNFYYIHKEGFSLYSGIAVGGSFNQTEISNISNTTNVGSNDKTDNSTLFAFHVNGIGARFGKTFGGFVEAGFGYSGLMSGGLYLNF